MRDFRSDMWIIIVPFWALLRFIHHRVRQRGLVFLKLNPIVQIEISAAERVFPGVFGLAQWPSGDLPSDEGADGSSLPAIFI
jgi:hypothetical protein